MANLKITDLKKYLKTLSMEELQNAIIALTKNHKEVKEYYSIKINPESENEILEKYKKIVKDEFFPDRGHGKLRYKIVRDAINDYKKISNNPKNISELMLTYVEFGVDFTNEYGDIDEQFYSNIEKAYDEALGYICKNDLEEEFYKQANEIMNEASDIGWGFGDIIYDIYMDYCSHLEE